MVRPLLARTSTRSHRPAAWTGAVLTLALSGSGCVPVGVHHLYHLLNPPTDLYEPIVRDDNFFGVAGEERSYRLEPRYVDFYELGLRSRGAAIPKTFRFQGRVRFELFVADERVDSQELTRTVSAYHAKDGSEGYARIALASFALPASRCDDEPTTMRLTVVEPLALDDAIVGSLELYVAVAATP